MRMYMCLEAHETHTQHLLKCCAYIFFIFVCFYFLLFIFSFSSFFFFSLFFFLGALRRAFFVRPIFRKLRAKFGICTNLGNVCF
jgi:hypothetical protein